MLKQNPYRPGAGLMPVYLAGREEDIGDMMNVFDALVMNIPAQSVIFSGLRGVGKTVLINRLQKLAEEKGIFCKHLEVESRNDFISQIAACSQAFLREVNTKEKLKNLIKKSMDAIKSLVISFNPGDNTFSLSVQDRELYQSGNLTQSMTDLFVAIGETAYESGIPICFFVDEIQYMNQEELNSLIAALHRTNQLGYPVIVVGAGLPKIYKMLSDSKSYSERLFVYREIGSLNESQSHDAIVMPVKKLGVEYTDEAVRRIVELTKGYPYFIQELCSLIYQRLEGKRIDIGNVENVIGDFYKALDRGFFRVRYERCSEGDKRFIFAMVQCGELPCTIANVAKNMGKTVNAISPARAQLINKGIIYSAHYRELDFTVPEFDGFIKRLKEYQYFTDPSREERKP